MEKFRKIFKYSHCNVIGMIHLQPLPGTPRSKLTVDALSELACKEAEIYAKYNLDGVIVENMHDVPYTNFCNSTTLKSCPEITAAMTRICSDVKRVLAPTNMPCGIQVLAGANKEALAVAQSSQFDFIRCEGFVFGHVADEGYMDSCAGSLLRYRKNIGAENVQVYCDIKKKHSAHAITSDVSIAETAKAAEFFLADGLIVTGSATGDPAQPGDLESVAKSVAIPVMVGSGVTVNNLHLYPKANALIIGSHFKYDGRWDLDIEPSRVRVFMEVVDSLKRT